jgi:hypothetical protein
MLVSSPSKSLSNFVFVLVMVIGIQALILDSEIPAVFSEIERNDEKIKNMTDGTKICVDKKSPIHQLEFHIYLCSPQQVFILPTFPQTAVTMATKCPKHTLFVYFSCSVRNMSFDLDDPLGDLLSDGSNDSFFGSLDKKPGKPAAAPKKPDEKPKTENVAKPTVSRQNKMENLFGLDLTDETQIDPPAAPKPMEVKKPVKSAPPPANLKPPSPTVVKNPVATEDDDFPIPVARSKIAKSANILDDLLGIKPAENPPKSLETRSSMEGKKNLSRQSTTPSFEMDEGAKPQKSAATLRKIGRSKTQILNDPLGLFGSSVEETPSKPEPASTPIWLQTPEAERKKEVTVNVSPKRKVVEVAKVVEDVKPQPVVEVVEVPMTVPIPRIEPEVPQKKWQKELAEQQDEQFHNLVQVHLSRQAQLHDQELELVEKSYKTQLATMEENLRYHISNSENIAEEKRTMEAEFKQKLDELFENHEKSLDALKSKHAEQMEELRTEHKAMISTLRESKLMEFAIVQDNTSYLKTLQAASANLENATEGLGVLRTNLQDQIDTVNQEKATQLRIRENRCEDLKQALEKQRDAAENEKSRMLELIHALELQASQQNQTSAEHDWVVRQQVAAMEAERTAFQREKEFFRERMKLDEKRIEDLKLSNLAEKEKQLKEINEERLQLLAEKARLEVSARLQKTSETTQSSGYEIDAAVKVAEEAARQADIERTKFVELQSQLEKQKRKLIDQESHLRTREAELEFSMHSARTKEVRRRGVKLLKEH